MHASGTGRPTPDLTRPGRVLVLLIAAGLLATTFVTSTSDPAAAAVTRIAGPNRYATAAELSRSEFPPGTATVYVANGENFPDALGGGAGAAAEDAPLLLTRPDSVPSATATELDRLNPTRVVVLGGTPSVSAATLTQLGTYATQGAVRVSGPDRFATAAAISQRAFPGGASTVFIVNGRNFPDALSGGAAAAHHGAPMLLTEAGSLPSATAAELTRLDPDQIVVLGGENMVSSPVAQALAQRATTVRMAGADRFATSAKVANQSFGHLSRVMIVSGRNWPDALAAAPVAARNGAAVVLSEQSCIPVTIHTLMVDLDLADADVIGSSASLSDNVAGGGSCGTPRAPASYRVLYIYPQNVSPVSRTTKIRDWLNEMNDWFSAETGGRRIRLERTGATINVTAVQVPINAVNLTFQNLYQFLEEQGHITDRRKVAAYIEDDGLACGLGGGNLATVWLDSCSRDPSGQKPDGDVMNVWASIMAHEIQHSMGAVPACAPNGANQHISGDTTDLMTPSINPATVLNLDNDRDDYYDTKRFDCADTIHVRYWERDL